MELGIVGLGRMGANMARRLMREDPHLQRPEHLPLREAVERRFASIPRLLEG